MTTGETAEASFERMQAKFDSANPATKATLKAILGMGLVVRAGDRVALDSRLDFVKEVLRAYGAALQFDTMRVLAEGMKKFPNEDPSDLMAHMMASYVTEETEATTRLATMVLLFKDIFGTDDQNQEKEQENGTQNDATAAG